MRSNTRAGTDDAASARRKRLMFFLLVDTAFVFFVLVPGLIYLFLLDNGLSQRDFMLYLVSLIALQAVVTVLLLWKFRLIPGPPMERKDAR